VKIVDLTRQIVEQIEKPRLRSEQRSDAPFVRMSTKVDSANG
jgi:hypothetical protein